jgi:hypothetical protein
MKKPNVFLVTMKLKDTDTLCPLNQKATKDLIKTAIQMEDSAVVVKSIKVVRSK